MAYKALYRTYRPTKFDEVVGQKHIIQVLKNSVSEGRVSHAYVFSGLRGIGKTTIARIFAKAVNCQNGVAGEPCNECVNCKKIINDETTDVIELDAASNNGVEQMREILETVNFLPSSLSKKVYIIDEAHMLSTAAFNALLKTLEEPPSHVIFILATTEPYKIPSTILSRCQRLDFKQLSMDEIIEMLANVVSKEKIKINDDALVGIAEASEGGMRDALSILDQARVYNFSEITLTDINNITGRVSHNSLIELVKSLNYKELEDSLDKVNLLIESGKEVNRILTNLIQLCRDLLLYKNLKENGTSPYVYQKEAFVELASEISEAKLFYFVDMFVDIQNKIRFTNSPKMYLEVGIIKIVNNTEIDIDIQSQIQKLEEKVDIIQPGDGITSLNETTNRLDVLENKMKKVILDLEKTGIKEFKESILSKINVLEDIVLKSKNEPLQLEEQIQDLKDALLELEEKINSSPKDEVTTNDNAQYQNNEALEKEIEILKEKVENISAQDNLTNKIDAIEMKVNSLNNEVFEEKIEKVTKEIAELKLKGSCDVVDKNGFEQPNQEYSDLVDKVNLIEEYINVIVNRIDEVARSVDKPRVITDSEGDDISEISQLNENYLVLLNHVQGLQSKLNELPESVDVENLNELESKLVGKIEEINSGIINKVNDEVARLEEKISNVKSSNNDELEAAVLANKQAIADVKEYSIKLSGKVQEVQDKITELKTKSDGGITKRKSPFEVVRDEEEKVETKEETKIVVTTDNTTVVKEKNIVQPTETVKVDETSRVYDAKIVERILHQARDQKCREEKISLLANWSKLEDKVGHLLAPTAKLLSEGTLTANGYNELLIVYPHASMCNHLMEPKGHMNALQILKITFGREYDFIALPENTWQEKRMEYAGQFNIGIKYPRLSPIKNPELKVVVVNSNNLASKKNQIVHNAKSFFGDDIVINEEE